MRVVAHILGLLSGIVGLIQSVILFFAGSVGGVLSTAAGDQESADEMAGGVVGSAVIFITSILALVAASYSKRQSIAGVIIFVIAGAIALIVGSTTVFTDATIWGVVYFIGAFFSFFGYRGAKKKANNPQT